MQALLLNGYSLTVILAVINVIIVGWSALLLIDLIVCGVMSDDENDMRDGARDYLVFDFGSTLLWMIQVMIHLLVFAQRTRNLRSTDTSMSGSVSALSSIPHFSSTLKYCNDVGLLILELFVAAYFVMDSIQVLHQWRTPETSSDIPLLDTAINFVAYLYQLLCPWYFKASSPDQITTTNGYTDISHDEPISQNE